MFVSLYDAFSASMENLWINILSLIPSLLGAFIILIFGLIISSLLGKFAKKIMKMTRIDKLSQSIGLKSEMENFGIKFDFSGLVGWTVKWFFIIATFIAVVDVLNISQLNVFLQSLVLYLPNVIVAILILAVGLIVGKTLKNVVQSGLGRTSVASKLGAFLSSLAKWSVFVFALMAALVQLGIAANLIQIILTGFVIMLSIAGGLAFGLGGREHAGRVLSWLEREITQKQKQQ